MFGLSGCAFRFGNVVGPRQTHGVGVRLRRRLLADPTRARASWATAARASPTSTSSDVVARGAADRTTRRRAGFEVFNVATGDYITVHRDRRPGRRGARRCRDVEFDFTRRRPRLEGRRPGGAPRHRSASAGRAGAKRSRPARRCASIEANLDEARSQIAKFAPDTLSAAPMSTAFRTRHRRADPDVTLLAPANDVAGARAVDRHPGAERGAHHRRLRRLVSRGHAQGRRRRRDPDRRQRRTDRTPETGASPAGARVLKTPKRGLGRAYMDAMPLHPRPLRADGRLRLHLRLPRAGAVRREVPRRRRVRHGLALPRLHRAGLDAARCTATSARR